MIYFIAAREVGRVKIGYSKHPAKRMEKMQAHSPVVLDLIGTINAPVHLERQLHTHFMPQHLHREWFAMTEGVAADIAALLEGTFDHGSFPKVARRSWVWAKRAMLAEMEAQAAAERSAGKAAA